MCAVTREPLPVDALLRFVAGPDDVLTPDIRRRLPGRGVNVGLSMSTVREAVRRKVFERSLKRPVKVSPTLAEDVRHLLRQDAFQALSLANKAGLVVAGFAKVEAALRAQRPAALLEASDAAADGRRKLAAAARRGPSGEAGEPPTVSSFTSNDFQLALGRDLVIHAALLPGPAAEGFLDRWRRLVRYEQEPGLAPAASRPGDETSIIARTAGPNAE